MLPRCGFSHSSSTNRSEPLKFMVHLFVLWRSRLILAGRGENLPLSWLPPFSPVRFCCESFPYFSHFSPLWSLELPPHAFTPPTPNSPELLPRPLPPILLIVCLPHVLKDIRKSYQNMILVLTNIPSRSSRSNGLGICWIDLEICQIQNLTPDQIIISPCNSISIKSVSDAVCWWRGPKMF